MSYSLDFKIGILSGSMLEVFHNLTALSETSEVKCCNDLSNTLTCGNGSSCANVCGDNIAGTGTLKMN